MKVLILCGLLFSASAYPWGSTGHRVVGEIAQKHLNLQAATQVRAILQSQSLARVSTWADEIKSEPETYKYTYNWHYTDWADEMHHHDETNSSGKLMTSINDHLRILKDPLSTMPQKEFSLKFLVHLIGDLHMPLHVGNGLDQGGNTCKVTFHGKPTNLHAVWDEAMIEFTNLSFSELSRFSSQGRTQTEINLMMSGTPADWALESKQLRATIYPDNVTAPLAASALKEYCRKDIVVPAEQMPKLGYEYSYKFMPVVETRLFHAGLRLAHLLNQNL